MKKNLSVLGILTASILFGFAYSVQAIGGKQLDPFSFNIGKYIIAVITILPFIFKKTNTSRKDEIIYGIVVGLLLFGFSYLQQVVTKDTTPGKVGFITSLYIVEVPLINFIFFKKKIGPQTGISLILSLIGLVLLCDLRGFSFRLSDLLIIICSLLLAAQITVVGKCCLNCDPFKLNFYSFIFILLLSTIGYFISGETVTMTNFVDAIWPIIYVGFGCSTVACVLQAQCQKTLDTTTTSLLLSLQSVFSVISGYLLLHQSLSGKELIGCALMFIGVILCVTDKGPKKKNS